MDRPTDPVSTRVLLWGVVAPLLVGSFVPALSGPALLWLVVGLGTLLVQAVSGALRRVDPGEDADDLRVADDLPDDLYEDLHQELDAAHRPVPVPAAPGRWWNRPLEDPNTAAARAGSWG